MPGIVGLITRKRREEAERELVQMVEALRHESFYVTGMWADESLGVYVGWVARKNSFSDGMPLQNERGDAVLVFSGEEFPEPGTIQRLKERGHDVDAAGPGYLVHLYEEDPSFPAGLNGRFHGLLVDRSRGASVLFNDRYGMERIYCHESKDAFYFAAEAKAILAVRPELRSIDPQALGEFVVCGCTLEDRSFFPGIQVLPGGSRWVFQNGSLVQRKAYFEPREWEDQEPLEPEPYYTENRDVFSRNLPRYFEGRERIGMSLTGGLDTRMIMAWQKQGDGSLPCYTFAGMLRDCQDVIVARQVAAMCGQSHEAIPLGEEFLARFSDYAERAVYLTDGCCDVSRAPDVYWNTRARQIAPVRMTGNYGGELLRGIRTFKPTAPRPGLFAADLHPHFSQTAQIYSEQIRGNPISFAMFKQAPWNHRGMLALEQTQLSLRSPFWDNDFVRMVFRAPSSALVTSEASIRLIAAGNRDLLRIPTDRGLLGEQGRVSSAASQVFFEFLFKAEYAYDMGMPQWLAQADHVFRGFHFERLFLGRHKISHFRSWYGDPLAPYVKEMLLDPRSLDRPYVQRKRLEEVVEGHLTGRRNYTTEIHKLLTLELLHRLFLDGPGTANLSERPGASMAASAAH